MPGHRICFIRLIRMDTRAEPRHSSATLAGSPDNTVVNLTVPRYADARNTENESAPLVRSENH